MTESTDIAGNIYGTVTSTPSTGTTSTTGTSSDDFGAGMDKDTFLQLLVAQMKYQNPLSPTDSDQYMSQMAMFSEVEKLGDLQQSQSDLLSWQRTVAGQGMIGKSITATSDDGTGAQVTGSVVGLKLTDAGPRLVLSDGETVSVDDVTDVTGGSSANTSTGSSSSSSGTTSGSTGSTSTSGTNSGSTGSS